MRSKKIFNILKIQNVTEIYVKSEDRLKFINSQIMFLKEYKKLLIGFSQRKGHDR